MERQYSCDKCNKSFNKIVNMQLHRMGKINKNCFLSVCPIDFQNAVFMGRVCTNQGSSFYTLLVADNGIRTFPVKEEINKDNLFISSSNQMDKRTITLIGLE